MNTLFMIGGIVMQLTTSQPQVAQVTPSPTPDEAMVVRMANEASAAEGDVCLY